ncbi:MAG: hypothetical protein Q4D80_04330 [Pseudomonadota bacterium]|nr:hypothetical protein [Pseudomonadota bacterium]
MSVKDKLNHLKTFVVGTVLASTTLSSCTNKEKAPEPVQDMLSLDYIDDMDMYGNHVRLHKVSIPVYRDESMTDQGYGQLLWGLDNNENISAARAGEKTHAERYGMSEHDYESNKHYVEVYDDGVLKANNSLILVNGRIKVIGDEQHYTGNLNRRSIELKEARELIRAKNEEKRRNIERYRMQVKEAAAADSIAQNSVENINFQEENGMVSGDSVKIDTVATARSSSLKKIHESLMEHHTKDTISVHKIKPLKKQSVRE